MPISNSDLLLSRAYEEMARLERQWRRNSSGDSHGRDGRAQGKDNGDLRITVQWHKPLPKPRPWPREREKTDNLVVLRAQPAAVIASPYQQKKHNQRCHASLEDKTIYHITGQSTRVRKPGQHDRTGVKSKSAKDQVKSRSTQQSRTCAMNHTPTKWILGNALHRLDDKSRDVRQRANGNHQADSRLPNQQPKVVFRTLRCSNPHVPPGPSQRRNPSSQPPRQQTGTNTYPRPSPEKQKILPRAHPSQKQEVHQRPSKANAVGAKTIQPKNSSYWRGKASDEEKPVYRALYMKQRGFEGTVPKASVRKDNEEAVVERRERRESKEQEQEQEQKPMPMRKLKRMQKLQLQQNARAFVAISPAPSEEEEDISKALALRPTRPRSPSQARPRLSGVRHNG